MIVGWRQVPVRKIRRQAGTAAAVPDVGMDAEPRTAVHADDETGAVPAPELPRSR